MDQELILYGPLMQSFVSCRFLKFPCLTRYYNMCGSPIQVLRYEVKDIIRAVRRDFLATHGSVAMTFDKLWVKPSLRDRELVPELSLSFAPVNIYSKNILIVQVELGFGNNSYDTSIPKADTLNIYSENVLIVQANYDLVMTPMILQCPRQALS
ncbi:hypothetical protein O6H91_01G138800 [Diphasiastrum complanatum]|uniref:Uncharacterized protein n=1 Tax=Diphasiastrum complanatum TaxID=34168 RepID=A0ACC2EWR4_DIPCM|nr:hypothetical protein O6H91_01G138800 [Diphasiastrum complanatum]